MPVCKSSSSLSKHRDIRLYFGRKSRREEDLRKKPELSHINTTTTCAPEGLLPQLMRCPLYVAPPRIGDLVDDGDKSVGELCSGLSHYLNLLDVEPESNPLERDKLSGLLLKHCIDWKIPETLGKLECRLVRKLLQHEVHRLSHMEHHDLENHILYRMDWLSSSSFLDGVSYLANLITNKEMCLEWQHAWDLLMVIEPVMKAESLIQTDPSISTLLTEQEKYILHHAIWQSEYPLYYLLSQEEKSKRPRTRRDSIGSPGKALRSMTNQTFYGQVTSLEFFFRKFLRASAAVIERTTADLGLSHSVRHTTWTLYMNALEEELYLRLLYQRHSLTIIACAVYSIAKLLDEDRSFAQIISCIQHQFPKYDEHWYKCIKLREDGTTCDLVRFYNNLYLERMRNRIYSLRQPRTPQKTVNSPFPTVMGSVAFSKNVVLDVSSSPRRAAPTGSPTCIAILGNLGVRRQSAEGNGQLSFSVARRLDF